MYYISKNVHYTYTILSFNNNNKFSFVNKIFCLFKYSFLTFLSYFLLGFYCKLLKIQETIHVVGNF